MRLRWKFRIHPRTRFTTYYPNPLWILPRQGHSIPLLSLCTPVASTLCPQCALRFKFCHETNCLTNRILTIATSHRRSKLDISCLLFSTHFFFPFASSCTKHDSRESNRLSKMIWIFIIQNWSLYPSIYFQQATLIWKQYFFSNNDFKWHTCLIYSLKRTKRTKSVAKCLIIFTCN